MINFGQPRVGDDKYAAFSNTKLTQYRVVHNRDLVPHNPTMEWPLNFHHSFYEEFEDSNHNVRQCNNTGEDPSCSNQFNPILLSITDHLEYLGRCMGVLCFDCGNWSNGSIEVMANNDAFLF